MCGIVSYFARESVLSWEHLDTLFTEAEKRGQDGFGIVIDQRTLGSEMVSMHSEKRYSLVKDQIKNFVDAHLRVNSLMIGICRAAPETEPQSEIKNLQPIVNFDIAVAHNGAVSNSIHRELQSWAETSGLYRFQSNNDSESIIAAYIKFDYNIKAAMEYLSGGFAAILYDRRKDCLYTINDFKPLAQGYIRGYGYILHSSNEAIGAVIEAITGCKRDGINLWEMWYHHYLSGGRIKSLDLASGFVSNIKYSPRYITQQWDSNLTEKSDEELCLVACSGGLDSSITLAMLQLAGYKNIIACHFKYGHRGQHAEEIAIDNVCKKLHIPVKVFDIEHVLRGIDQTSMLTNPNAEITTGTAKGLKKLDAWVNCRNTQFLTWMLTFAESQVFKFNYKKVYFLGGFLNLSESGHYPDNSEYFLSSFLDHAKYGSLIGNRIEPMFCLSNLMKHELFVLIKEFKLTEIYQHTISCDRPYVLLMGDPSWPVEVPANCCKDGIPACGSGLLSYWASKMVGLDDMKLRQFYVVDDKEYQAYIPEHLKKGFSKTPNIMDIINRILLPPDKIQNILRKLKEAS